MWLKLFLYMVDIFAAIGIIGALYVVGWAVIEIWEYCKLKWIKKD